MRWRVRGPSGPRSTGRVWWVCSVGSPRRTPPARSGHRMCAGAIRRWRVSWARGGASVASGGEGEGAILRGLARAVSDAGDALRTLERTLAHLDGLRARARWAREYGGTAVTPGGSRLRLRRARHPLLAMQEQLGGRAVVP